MDNHKTLLRDFPGGPVVKSPLCNAGDMGSIPGQGTEIPHTTEQLSPLSATAREFALPQKIPRATTRTQPKKPYEVQWQGCGNAGEESSLLGVRVRRSGCGN